MQNKLAFITEGGEVERYHTVRTLQTETVGHHSFGVAMFCHLLLPESSKDLILAALTHDLAEHRLGDIPSPAKKEYGIGEQVNELEEKLLRSVGLNFELLPEEKRALKLADIFQGMSFCLRELQLGNRKHEVIYRRYASYAESFVLCGEEKNLFELLSGEYHELG